MDRRREKGKHAERKHGEGAGDVHEVHVFSAILTLLTAVRVEAGKRNNVKIAVSFYHNKRKEEKVVKLQ